MSVDFLKMNTVDKAVESYLGVLEDADATRLRFFHGLWKVQDSLTGGAAPYAVPTREEATAAVKKGESVFSQYEVAVDRDAYLDALAQVGAYVAENAGLADEQVAALKAIDFSQVVTQDDLATAPTDITGFLAATYERIAGADEDAESESASEETVLAPAVFALVAIAALTPLIAGAAADARKAIDTKALALVGPQECPVCGTAATISFVGERSSLQGGDRKLWCGFCHTSWPYGRLRCARCGNRSSTSLRYSHTEEDPGHRVHLCEDCKGYIRTVFHDEVQHIVSPVVEDVVTSHLHVIAAQLGFTEAGDGIKRDVSGEAAPDEPVNLEGTF